MSSSETLAADPALQYAKRLAARRASVAVLARIDDRLSTTRLILAALFLGLLWLGGAGRLAAWSAFVPLGLFGAAVAGHHRTRRLRAQAARAVKFYQLICDRLNLEVPTGPPAAGVGGQRFLDQHHLYAADLDLFGPQSLFARLCNARTPMGEDTLAAWLLGPAAQNTILERQSCVQELRGLIDLREHLAILGEPARLTLNPRKLVVWATATDGLPTRWLGSIAWLLSMAGAGAALLWGVGGPAYPLLAVVIVEAGLLYQLRQPLHAVLSEVEHAHEDLRLIALLVKRIESENFAAAPLERLRARFRSGDTPASPTPASARLSRLATIVNFVEARRNPLLAPLLTLSLYPLHAALAAERWRRRHGHAVANWLDALGEIEALQALAAYSAERPADPFPEFLAGAAAFIASGVGHPLIGAEKCVRNDVTISGATRILMVSGSNMSGKSTLLRAVGINTVLAMAGAPVCATRLQLTPLHVGASIRVNDSLHEGSSRFYAEITRLRQLFEIRGLPLLFLLDELLQGTNSNDRQVGARGVLSALIERGAIGLVSTHDLRLSEEAGFGAALKNVHLQDELRDGKLSFDFKLRDGVVTKSNGIELMRAVGLDV